jgi:hypothetical protein
MTKIGVLITSKEDDERLGIMEFDPTGILVCSTFKAGIHPFALKTFLKMLDQPLYVKHADIISRDKVLSRELLISEAEDLAARINEKSMTLGGRPILAASVEWKEIA